jgi:hypothetical protein
MAASLAQVLRQIARKKAEAREIKRVEVVGVMPDGTHFLASGQAAKVSGRAEFRVGEIVDVLPAPTPLILGHKWQKGDVPGVRPRLEFEEVEEIVMTQTSNPDGGVDHFLRSPFGLFYLDLRTAVQEVAENWADFLVGTTLFPVGSPYLVRWGQRDNAFGVLVFRPSAVLADKRIVLYVFQLSRPLHKINVPSSRIATVAGQEYQVADCTLVALYDFRDLPISTGLNVSVSGSTSRRQLLPVFERTLTYTWNEGESSYDSPVLTPFTSFVIEVPLSTAFAANTSYQPVLDMAHAPQVGGLSFANYAWRILQFWIDQDNRPVLAVELQNTWGDGSSVAMRAYNASGSLANLSDEEFDIFFSGSIGAGKSLSLPVGGHDFGERPLLLVRLDQDSIAGGILGSVLSKTCDPTVSIASSTESPAFATITDVGNVTRSIGNLKTTSIRIGGPQAGITASWELQRFQSSNIGLPIPVGFIEVGSFAFSNFDPKTYSWSGLKADLLPVFSDARTIGTQLTRSFFMQGAEASAPFHSIRFDVTQSGFLSGGAPTTELVGVFDGRSRPSTGQSDDPFSDADVVLVMDRTLDGFPPFGPGQTGLDWAFHHGVASGLWRSSPSADLSAELSFVTDPSGVPFGILSKPIINKDLVLIESQAAQTSKLVRLDDLSEVVLPADLQSQPPAAETLFLAVLAPDRLYDQRDAIGRFRAPSDPSTLIRGPQSLPPLTNLAPFGLAGDFHLAVHTVGTRTLKG